jgi:tetratricopeptide (TPR) repeat protein
VIYEIIIIRCGIYGNIGSRAHSLLSRTPNAALAGGDVELAVDLYTSAIESPGALSDTALISLLKGYCNRSLAYTKLERYQEALGDAEYVLVRSTENNSAGHDVHALEDIRIKSFHRKAQALWHMGQQVNALHVYKEAVRDVETKDDQAKITSPGEQNEGNKKSITTLKVKDCRISMGQSICAAAILAVSKMPHSWLAEYCIGLVQKSARPHPISKRDGLLLKNVPLSIRMEESDMKRKVLESLEKDVIFLRACQRGVVDLWRGVQSLRSLSAYVRGYAYFTVGDNISIEQGQRDASVALVYGPQDVDEGRCMWSAAFALRAACYEKSGDNIPAILDVMQAIELQNQEDLSWEEENGREEDVEGYQSPFEEALVRLLPRIPEHYAAAINEGCGYAGLVKMMEAEKERMQPEYLKKRPKYYYYYEWMKKRIQGRHPSIKEEIMDKLLTLDAAELDLLLQYPQAIDMTVNELKDVLEERGEAGLESYEVPLLSWEKVSILKEGGNLETLGNRPEIPALESAS